MVQSAVHGYFLFKQTSLILLFSQILMQYFHSYWTATPVASSDNLQIKIPIQNDIFREATAVVNNNGNLRMHLSCCKYNRLKLTIMQVTIFR
jgi:hypothetical protein